MSFACVPLLRPPGDPEPTSEPVADPFLRPFSNSGGYSTTGFLTPASYPDLGRLNRLFLLEAAPVRPFTYLIQCGDPAMGVIEWAVAFGTFLAVGVGVQVVLIAALGPPANAGASWFFSGAAGLAAAWFVTKVFGSD